MFKYQQPAWFVAEFFYELGKVSEQLRKREEAIRMLRDLLNRLANGDKCLTPNRFAKACVLPSTFEVKVTDSKKEVFSIVMNISGIYEQLYVNFGLVDRGLSMGRLVIGGASSRDLKDNTAESIYQWMVGVQHSVAVARMNRY